MNKYLGKIVMFMLLLICSGMNFPTFAEDVVETDSIEGNQNLGDDKGKQPNIPLSGKSSEMIDLKTIVIVLLIIVVIALALQLIRLRYSLGGDIERDYGYRGGEEERELKSKIFYLNNKIKNLEAELEDLSRSNVELEKLLSSGPIYVDAIDEGGKYYEAQEKSSQSEECSPKVTNVYTSSYLYADVDVKDGYFTRVSEKSSKRSSYQINVNKETFELINDDELYDMYLSNLSSYGILNACEVEGSYARGKMITVIPGRVKKDDCGWLIVEKCKIETR